MSLIQSILVLIGGSSLRHKGATLAIDFKNNANKFAKWIALALLASADMMKLECVSWIH